MAGGGGVGADCAYLGQGSAAQTCNLSQGPARGRVCFCSSGGRLVPGIGGSVSACFPYMAALCLCKMPFPHADGRLLRKPAAVIQFVENTRAQWSPNKKNMAGLQPLCRKRSCLPPSKPMLYLTAPRTGPNICFSATMLPQRGVIEPPRGPCRNRSPPQ